MKTYLTYFIMAFALFTSQLIQANELSLKNCMDPYKLCPSDMIAVTLESIDIHPGTTDKGGQSNTDLELNYFFELGFLGHYTSTILWWHGTNDDYPRFEANTSEEVYTVEINKVYQGMINQEIKIFNARENNIKPEDFYSKINLVVKERRVIGSSNICIIPLAKPERPNNYAFHTFTQLIAEATSNEDRTAEKEIVLRCTNERKKADLSFHFLFKFQRQQIETARN